MASPMMPSSSTGITRPRRVKKGATSTRKTTAAPNLIPEPSDGSGDPVSSVSSKGRSAGGSAPASRLWGSEFGGGDSRPEAAAGSGGNEDNGVEPMIIEQEGRPAEHAPTPSATSGPGFGGSHQPLPSIFSKLSSDPSPAPFRLLSEAGAMQPPLIFGLKSGEGRRVGTSSPMQESSGGFKPGPELGALLDRISATIKANPLAGNSKGATTGRSAMGEEVGPRFGSKYGVKAMKGLDALTQAMATQGSGNKPIPDLNLPPTRSGGRTISIPDLNLPPTTAPAHGSGSSSFRTGAHLPSVRGGPVSGSFVFGASMPSSSPPHPTAPPSFQFGAKYGGAPGVVVPEQEGAEGVAESSPRLTPRSPSVAGGMKSPRAARSRRNAIHSPTCRQEAEGEKGGAEAASVAADIASLKLSDKQKGSSGEGGREGGGVADCLDRLHKAYGKAEESEAQDAALQETQNKMAGLKVSQPEMGSTAQRLGEMRISDSPTGATRGHGTWGVPEVGVAGNSGISPSSYVTAFSVFGTEEASKSAGGKGFEFMSGSVPKDSAEEDTAQSTPHLTSHPTGKEGGEGGQAGGAAGHAPVHLPGGPFPLPAKASTGSSGEQAATYVFTAHSEGLPPATSPVSQRRRQKVTAVHRSRSRPLSSPQGRTGGSRSGTESVGGSVGDAAPPMASSPSTKEDAVQQPLASLAADLADLKLKGEVGGRRGWGAWEASLVSSRRWRQRGNEAHKSGRYAEAEGHYSTACSQVREHLEVDSCCEEAKLCWSNRAATRMQMHRMREALQDCHMALKMDPHFLRGQLRAASCHLALGESEAARKVLVECQRMSLVGEGDPRMHSEAMEGLDKVRVVEEKGREAIRLLLPPSDPLQALKAANEALAWAPLGEEVMESKAKALLAGRRFQEVVTLCDATLPLALKNVRKTTPPTDPALWRQWYTGRARLGEGKLDEALELMMQVERESRGGTCGVETEAVSGTVSEMRSVQASKSAGNAAFAAGRHVDAQEQYTCALSSRLMPESRVLCAVLFCNRAASSQALGAAADAIADCSRAIALDPLYVKALSRRAALYESVRDHGQAKADLQRLAGLVGATKGAEVRQRLRRAEENCKREVAVDHYLMLGVEVGAIAAEVKKAYRRAALRHHPDKAGQFLVRNESDPDGATWRDVGEEVQREAERLFKLVGEAYALLSDPAKRQQYDLEEQVRKGRSVGEQYGRSGRRRREAWEEGWGAAAPLYRWGAEGKERPRAYTSAPFTREARFNDFDWEF